MRIKINKKFIGSLLKIGGTIITVILSTFFVESCAGLL